MKMDGLILIDKPEGFSSNDVVRKIKTYFPRGTKIGHAGTLDPFATGLVVILIGRATKKFDEFQEMKKEYVVTAEFGYETDTQDKTGEVVAKTEVVPTKEDLVAAAEKFIGQISQLPPAYSAKKVNGKRAYELARAGQKVELKPKRVWVYELELLELRDILAKFRVVCSSGTHIRTLVLDLAKLVGSLATAVELRRTKVGEWNVEDSVKLATASAEEVVTSLIPA